MGKIRTLRNQKLVLSLTSIINKDSRLPDKYHRTLRKPEFLRYKKNKIYIKNDSI